MTRGIHDQPVATWPASDQAWLDDTLGPPERNRPAGTPRDATGPGWGTLILLAVLIVVAVAAARS